MLLTTLVLLLLCTQAYADADEEAALTRRRERTCSAVLDELVGTAKAAMSDRCVCVCACVYLRVLDN